MLGRAPLIAFIPVSDLRAARDFYVSTLGLTVTDENPFALVLDANGTMLRLTPVPQLEPRSFTVAGWAVTDMEEAIDALAARGVAFTRFDGMGQDPKGIWTSPGGDLVAWFADPDGNTLSLTSFGPA